MYPFVVTIFFWVIQRLQVGVFRLNMYVLFHVSPPSKFVLHNILILLLVVQPYLKKTNFTSTINLKSCKIFHLFDFIIFEFVLFILLLIGICSSLFFRWIKEIRMVHRFFLVSISYCMGTCRLKQKQKQTKVFTNLLRGFVDSYSGSCSK